VRTRGAKVFERVADGYCQWQICFHPLIGHKAQPQVIVGVASQLSTVSSNSFDLAEWHPEVCAFPGRTDLPNH
jgi:hypothetical protein